VATDEHAKEYLDYYLELTSDPDFAVMLEGPWGSGKSYFVNQYFRARFAGARKKNTEAKDPLIHVTLFGVRELSDITAQMFEKVYPALSGKTANAVNTIASRALSVVGLRLDPKENAELLQGMLLNLKDKIIVFDDFERSPLPLVEVMGYINRYVEHHKLKVVVVASEEDIPEGQIEEYKKRKEKLIGKTIRVGSDPSVVLDIFVAKLTSAESIAVIQKQREKLLITFKASTKPNLRSLRAILLDYERLVTLVDPRLRAQKIAMAELLLYMIAVGMEFRSGGLDVAKLRALQNDAKRGLAIRSKSTPQSDGDLGDVDLRRRYELVSWSDPVVPPESLAELFASGSFSIAAVNEHLSRHPSVVGYAEAPAWRLMWNWHDLPETNYRRARDTVERQLKAREIVHPGQILHIAGTCLRLRAYGDDLLGGQAVEAYFCDYLADLETSGALEAAPELFGLMGGSYAGLGYNEHDTPDFKKVHALVKAASARALDRRMRSEAPDLLARLRSDPSNVSMLHEWGLRERKYGGIAILNHVVVTDFADLAIVDSKLNDKLLAALSERYRQGYSTELAAEVDWLGQLRAELDSRVIKAAPPYVELGKIQLAYFFKDIDNLVAAASGKSISKS
jgi:hypothetical protein